MFTASIVSCLSGSCRPQPTQLILFRSVVLWSTNWMSLVVTCLVVVKCPLIGHLVLSFVIGQLDRRGLRTPAQVGSWVASGVCVSQLNCIFVIFWAWFCVYLRLFCVLTHTHTHTCLMALCPGIPGWAGTKTVKPIWISLKQETVSGSGISWVICKSARCSSQITIPAPHHSVFYRPDAIPATQPTASKHRRHNFVCSSLNILYLIILDR